MTLNDNDRLRTGIILTSWWIVYDFAPSRQQCSRQRDTVDYREASWSRSYYKLNRVSMKRVSRMTPVRKNTLFSCICVYYASNHEKEIWRKEKVLVSFLPSLLHISSLWIERIRSLSHRYFRRSSAQIHQLFLFARGISYVLSIG